MVLDRPLRTPRLRIAPVTRTMMAAAAKGRAALEQAIRAGVDDDWRWDHVFHDRRRVAVADRPSHALMIHEADRRLIGEVRFEAVPEIDGFEIGYAVVPRYRRRGLAVEGVGAVLRMLEAQGAGQIIAGCAMRNVASARTLRRLGFTLDGSNARTASFWWVRFPRG
ncbi:MAG: GNAT family N-acetyltransferase [Hyphomonadaceae bacterium]|nr:GNAT family N-acetyltransferase [Hyphomonadaceae bacterium]